MNKNLLYLLLVLVLAAAAVYFVARMYRLPSAKDVIVAPTAPAQAPVAQPVQVAPSSPTAPAAPTPASQAPAEVDVAIVEDTTETP